MKSFIKGFLLGFGLMACFFVGIIATKAYEIFIIPKDELSFSIRAQGLDLAKAQALAAAYSKELNKDCQIKRLDIDESILPIYASEFEFKQPHNAPQVSKASGDDSAQNEANAQNETTEASGDVVEASGDVVEASGDVVEASGDDADIKQVEITPSAKRHIVGFLSLTCHRRAK